MHATLQALATELDATLIEAERSGSMSHDECKAMVALMIFAGHETTSNLLAIGQQLLTNRIIGAPAAPPVRPAVAKVKKPGNGSGGKS